MKIIKANETHIPEILEIYVKARKFMKENGNPTQWEEGYPSREIVEKDIAADHCYVCIENENVAGVFVFIIGENRQMHLFSCIRRFFPLFLNFRCINDRPADFHRQLPHRNYFLSFPVRRLVHHYL